MHTQGAFLMGKRVNYRAILETALDIAKGMLQLHQLDLVHSDLKVWNWPGTPSGSLLQDPHHLWNSFSSG